MGNTRKINVDYMNVHRVMLEVLPLYESSPILMINALHFCLEKLSTLVILVKM